MHNIRSPVVFFYGSLILLYFTDMGMMIGMIWASLAITNSPFFLGLTLCLGASVPYIFKKIFSKKYMKSLTLKRLYMMRIILYVLILSLIFINIAETFYGLFITIILFGIVNVFTLTTYETYNSYFVNQQDISSDIASRVMQTVLQSGAFLGAVIAGLIIKRFGYLNLILFLSLFELLINFVFLYNKYFDVQLSPVNKISLLKDNKEKPTKPLYLFSLSLAFIGVHISAFNLLSTIIFQDLNQWDSEIFGYASGIAGIGAFIASFITLKRIPIFAFILALLSMDYIYSYASSITIAITSSFFIGFCINTVRIYLRKIMLDYAKTPYLSHKMGEISTFFYVFFQSLGSVIIGLIISENIIELNTSRIILSIIGLFILISFVFNKFFTKQE
ncbi:hypothetical protein THUN1656_07160 [Rodentibacter abscessus]